MSTELLKEIQERTKRTNRNLKLQRCELNLQAYSYMGLQLKHVDPNSPNSGTNGPCPSSIRFNT